MAHRPRSDGSRTSSQLPIHLARSLDCGVTGLAWAIETGAEFEELADLRAPWPKYGPVRWVLAVKEDSPFRTPKDLAEVVHGLIQLAPEKRCWETAAEVMAYINEQDQPLADEEDIAAMVAERAPATDDDALQQSGSFPRRAAPVFSAAGTIIIQAALITLKLLPGNVPRMGFQV